MENQYYIPEYDDFHIGIIYEEDYHKNGNWSKVEVFGGASEIEDWEMAINAKRIRIKYLDKENILSLGWKLTNEEVKQYSNWCNFKHKDYEMGVQLNNKYFPRILNIRALKHCYWKGNIKIQCKSINELKKAMELINIK